jgi:peptidoglycan/xylan/chitin deacetylase (PgdA/CDA1 family)
MKGFTRLKRYYRKIVDYVDPKAVILMYHRVAKLAGYSYPISVTPNNFRQQMEVLWKAFQPIRLDELAEMTLSGAISRRAVAVTFDDGYADNYLQALPILEEFQIPATIFVSSGYINGCQEYWWDDLERILLSTEMLPEQLEISVEGLIYSWSMKNMEQRRSTHKQVHLLLKPLHPEQRECLLDAMVQWAGLGRQGRVEHRSMTGDELRHLANSPLIQIGGHSINHTQLAALPLELQYQEIVQDRQALETTTGKPLKTFSYPFGGPDDFSQDTVRIVQEAGYQAACSTQHSRVIRGANIYRLPRYWVGDWNAEIFQLEMAEFFQR